MFKQFYHLLSTPENNGRKIGLLRTFCAIFGGLIVSYLGMTLLAIIIPIPIKESTILSIMFNTLAWAACATWIALSYTKLHALLKVIIPIIIFSLALIIWN